MVNKYTLTAVAIGALLAGAPEIAQAPSNLNNLNHLNHPREIVRTIKSSLEEMTKTRDKQSREFENKLKRLQRNYELSGRDTIYATIFPFYENMIIPDYLTMESVRSIVKIESSDDSKAIGKAGEIGWGQFTKETWYKVMSENFEKNAFIPWKNIEAIIKYLLFIDNFCKKNDPNWNKMTDKEKREMIIASYNAGFKSLEKNWDINEIPESTKDHLKKFNNAYQEFSSL